MNTTRPTRFTPATGRAIHESVRTSVSKNIDADGKPQRVIRNSRLLLCWQAGELAVRCDVTTVKLSGERHARRARGVA